MSEEVIVAELEAGETPPHDLVEEEHPNLDADQWVELFGDELFYFALKRVRNRELAEDLVQDTFVSAFKKIDTFAGRSSIRTWLFSILRNKIIDNSRRKKVEKNFMEKHFDSDEANADFNSHGIWTSWVADWASQPDIVAEGKEFKLAIELCMDGLPDKLKEALELRVAGDMTTEEICNALDISSSNLWVLVHRARMTLRKCVDKHQKK